MHRLSAFKLRLAYLEYASPCFRADRRHLANPAVAVTALLVWVDLRHQGNPVVAVTGSWRSSCGSRTLSTRRLAFAPIGGTWRTLLLRAALLVRGNLAHPSAPLQVHMQATTSRRSSCDARDTLRSAWDGAPCSRWPGTSRESCREGLCLGGCFSFEFPCLAVTPGTCANGRRSQPVTGTRRRVISRRYSI